MIDEVTCKRMQSDTATSKDVKVFCYCVLLVGISECKAVTHYLIADIEVSDLLLTVLAVPQKMTEILLRIRRWLID